MSSAIEVSSEAHRADLSSEIAHPNEAEQARLVISSFSQRGGAGPTGFGAFELSAIFLVLWSVRVVRLRSCVSLRMQVSRESCVVSRLFQMFFQSFLGFLEAAEKTSAQRL